MIEVFEGETFVWVDGYEGKYKVSNFGRVVSIGGRLKKRNKNGALVGGICTSGYPVVALRRPGERYTERVHRLVAKYFVKNPNPEKFNVINHIDGNKKNNHFSNLEWCDIAHNISEAFKTGLINRKGERHEHSKLTDSQVIEMRAMYANGGLSQRAIADCFPVSRRQVSDILNGICWGHLPVPDYSNVNKIMRPSTQIVF